ncbi:hypothetical protein P3S68_018581 [Capsicum galapagoense]
MGGLLSSLVGGGEAQAATEESGSPSRMIAFHSSNRWQINFNNSNQLNKLIVVDFAASWCGPCKFMEPAINAMASKYPDVDFVKIVVDELSDVAQEFGVQAMPMPTFLLLKQGKEVERVVGAKKDELEKKILKHREAPEVAFFIFKYFLSSVVLVMVTLI